MSSSKLGCQGDEKSDYQSPFAVICPVALWKIFGSKVCNKHIEPSEWIKSREKGSRTR